jgi:hypothetical protein
MRFKKADAGVTIIVVIVIIVFIGWLISYGGMECRKDSDCGDNKYCGADGNCHEMKVITQTIVKHDYAFPAVFIGLSIIAAAFILRWKRGL